MKESKTSRQVIAIGLEPFHEGETFAKWPLHITVLPWFRIGRQKRLHRALEDVAVRQAPLVAKIGEHAMFGEKEDKPVRLVQPANAFRSLHLATMSAVHGSGVQFEDLSYMGYRYSPHVTTWRDEALDEAYEVSSMALIGQNAARYKFVEKVFDFGG